LHENAPNGFRTQQDLAVAYSNLGTTKSRLGDAEGATADYDKSLAILRPLADADPEEIELQTQFALVLARSGRHAEAGEKAEELCKLAPENYRTLYNVACCYSLCAAAVSASKDEDDIAPEQRALREEYANRAVAALGEAMNHGLEDVSYALDDPDLAEILEHAAFKKLLAERG
jgi:tetratricopeptide (TPR) repeat protein